MSNREKAQASGIPSLNELIREAKENDPKGCLERAAKQLNVQSEKLEEFEDGGIPKRIQVAFRIALDVFIDRFENAEKCKVPINAVFQKLNEDARES